jgi:uncharacterized protein (TIGR03083 family)
MNGAPLVGYDRLLELIGVEGELLADSATGANPDADVPNCPGLKLGETVRHVGSLYRMVLAWVRAGDRPTAWQREPDDGQSVEDYFRAGLRAVIAHLSAHDPDEHCPTWWPEHQNYGFWCRRLAHETTVHRVDVQNAAGMSLRTVAEDTSVDGVDEILELWFGHRLSVLGVSGTRHGRVRIRAGGREWIARATPNGTSVRFAEPGDAVDGTVFGDPMSMFLWLWGRYPPHFVTREGSDDAIAQLWALLRLATR